eukprot:9477738-Pyramimonas_sp.AAC.1
MKTIQETVQQAETTRVVVKTVQGGAYIDYDEAEEKYKNKPKQWENIKKHAKMIHCPVRGVDMLQIPEYKDTQENEHVRESIRKRKAE